MILSFLLGIVGNWFVAVPVACLDGPIGFPFRSKSLALDGFFVVLKDISGERRRRRNHVNERSWCV